MLRQNLRETLLCKAYIIPLLTSFADDDNNETKYLNIEGEKLTCCA